MLLDSRLNWSRFELGCLAHAGWLWRRSKEARSVTDYSGDSCIWPLSSLTRCSLLGQPASTQRNRRRKLLVLSPAALFALVLVRGDSVILAKNDRLSGLIW